jgi:hypothetical protein
LVKKGNDFGWPYCYYDQLQKKKVLGPEYGGDGKKQGRCADKEQPILGFPGHWRRMIFCFIRVKCSLINIRMALSLPFMGAGTGTVKTGRLSCGVCSFKNGKPSGNYEIFANGFAGKESIAGPGQAKYRPCGLAQGQMELCIFLMTGRVGYGRLFTGNSLLIMIKRLYLL